MSKKRELALKKARKIKMVLLDVDGVMTDGRFLLDGRGSETRKVLPCPSSLSTSIRPRWASTILREW